MASHVFTGRLASREPVRVGNGLGIYHVVCMRGQSRTPVGVAASRETLLAGGGDVLWPGSSMDIESDGVHLCAPLQGGLPAVSVELRAGRTSICLDARGAQAAIHSYKGHTRVLPQGEWVALATNIVGMTDWELRAERGNVFVDSHPDLTLPPGDTQANSGMGVLLRPSDPPRIVPGNQNLYAYSFGPSTRLYMAKLCSGYDFVVRVP